MAKEDLNKLHSKIRKLVALWYSCLWGHHKDRDCHFIIQMDWKYDGQFEISIYHNGYLTEWDATSSTLEGAMLILYEQLKDQIDWWLKQSVCDDECEAKPGEIALKAARLISILEE